MEKIIRAPGTKFKRLDKLSVTSVPDCWPIIDHLTREGSDDLAASVHELWYLANDLLWNLRHPTELALANLRE